MCILITVCAYSQPFASLEGSTKGFGLSVGIKNDQGLQVAAGYNVSIFNKTNPDIFYGAIGYNIYLSSEDGFVLLPSIGVAKWSAREITKNYSAVEIKDIKPMYGLELGKTMNIGRLYISANKCKTVYYGLGIKVFID